jgi:1-aminocyclopropane-1-carboxylate deaminase/D-cysteine desulfhydrase-like pyridoxal-dependent ACC family enzyme
MKNLFSLYPLCDLPRHSRIHSLPSLSQNGASVFVKREDELGALSFGVKIRKYLSLLPYLAKQHHEIAILGSKNSNNVLALSMLLKEKKISHTLFLNQERDAENKGNALFTMLANDPENIVWVDQNLPSEDVPSHFEKSLNKKFFWVPIGSSCKASLPGALTLVEDILQNEREHNITFDHIFIDAGTGFSAAALLLGLGVVAKHLHVHTVQVAGGDMEFYVMLEDCKVHFKNLYAKEPTIPPFSIIRPYKARSFGSISQEHMQFIRSFAKTEGIFLDPMYNAKLFLEAKRVIVQENLLGNILIIQSGGTLALSGFTT